ncbi:MAG: hypothetical protein QOI51_1483, partial [Nocardioidaceae bacterium]|nr:hypothetical protein [Nocardioidaceae bacterium]
GRALASVVDVPAWTLGEDAVQQRLSEALRVRAGVDELVARLTASILGRELPRLAGASSGRAWLMATHRMSAPEAARLVTQANACTAEGLDGRAETTRRAWATGDVHTEQAVVIAQTVGALNSAIPATATDALQHDLVGHARRLGYPQLRQVCRHALEVVDPDGADTMLEAQLLAEEDRALQLTQFQARRVGDGTTRGSFRLPDAQFDMLKAALDAAASPRRPRRGDSPDDPEHASNADASSKNTSAGPAAAQGRPGRLGYPQRMGRAFLELIEHLPTSRLPQHGVANATIVVTMGLDQLRDAFGETVLDSGTAMSAGQTRRLACNAQLIPAVLAGDSTILDLGLAQRLFTRYQRIALAVRDRGCIWPGCDRPPAWCEAHHITAWKNLRPTNLDNGCLLCSFHHHLAHQGEWAIVMAADGVPDVIPPPRVEPNQQPLRHARFTLPALC